MIDELYPTQRGIYSVILKFSGLFVPGESERRAFDIIILNSEMSTGHSRKWLFYPVRRAFQRHTNLGSFHFLLTAIQTPRTRRPRFGNFQRLLSREDYSTTRQTLPVANTSINHRQTEERIRSDINERVHHLFLIRFALINACPAELRERFQIAGTDSLLTHCGNEKTARFRQPIPTSGNFRGSPGLTRVYELGPQATAHFR